MNLYKKFNNNINEQIHFINHFSLIRMNKSSKPQLKNPSSNRSNEAQLLFNIDLKVGGKLITLNVYENDTIQTLLSKHRIINGNYHEKYKKIKEKILQNIQREITNKMKVNDLQLAKKLELFLNNQIQVNRYQNQEICQLNIEVQQNFQDRLFNDDSQKQQVQESKNKQTPFKLLLQNSTNQKKSSSKGVFKNNPIRSNNSDKKNKQNPSSKKKPYPKYPQSLLALKQLIQCDGNLNNMNMKNLESCDQTNKKQHKQSNKKHEQNKPQKLNNQTKKPKKKIDDDLIKAYEVIIKKSKDKSMRQMAQNTLKQYNLLQQLQQTNKPVIFCRNNTLTSQAENNELNNCLKSQNPDINNMIQNINSQLISKTHKQQKQKFQKNQNSQQLSQLKQQSSLIRKSRTYSYNRQNGQQNSLTRNYQYPQYKQAYQRRKTPNFMYLNNYQTEYLRNNYDVKNESISSIRENKESFSTSNIFSSSISYNNNNRRYKYLVD